jgi:hypothetical protein
MRTHVPQSGTWRRTDGRATGSGGRDEVVRARTGQGRGQCRRRRLRLGGACARVPRQRRTLALSTILAPSLRPGPALNVSAVAARVHVCVSDCAGGGVSGPGDDVPLVPQGRLEHLDAPQQVSVRILQPAALALHRRQPILAPTSLSPKLHDAPAGGPP